jgi:hypothetical protein
MPGWKGCEKPDAMIFCTEIQEDAERLHRRELHKRL